MSESTSPAPSSPMCTKNESHLGVTFNPKTKEALYQTYLPHGEQLTLHTQIYLLGGYTCTEINISFNGDTWIQTGHTEHLQVEQSGVTCSISGFGEKTADIIIVNNNSSDSPVILGFVPVFMLGDEIFKGVDPQIVLPPSKVPHG